VLDPASESSEAIQSNHTDKTCIFKSSGRLKKGTVIILTGGIELIVTNFVAPGRATIRFPVRNSEFLNFLSKYGSTPLPPYIRQTGSEELTHSQRYQTIYSKIPGSIAAPTAGLHFSPETFETFASEGIETIKITLHIGPGTFIPIRSNDIRLHSMEPEYYSIPETAAEFLREAKRSRRRIIAVGSTSVRTLEASYTESGFRQISGYTDLFIIPGYRFNVVEGMITNFHLPESTLLALVCAFAGSDSIMRAYQEAVRENYRFYSYGDACLII
jgi:S-adenosylmethionine:tRNA ribosyltransferase-isomerase